MFTLLESQDIMFTKINHATFKMGNCEDSHIATCMLDNKTNVLSHMLPPSPCNSKWKCSTTKMLKDIGKKNSLMPTISILLCWNNNNTFVCP